ncbi:hypothetical protein PMAYCL1PPCAC_16782, partial [Pristionchus mayeri]
GSSTVLCRGCRGLGKHVSIDLHFILTTDLICCSAISTAGNPRATRIYPICAHSAAKRTIESSTKSSIPHFIYLRPSKQIPNMLVEVLLCFRNCRRVLPIVRWYSSLDCHNSNYANTVTTITLIVDSLSSR